ncbi:MAG: S8 family serine peptidase [Nitrospira sp.]|nr:S8 family serine peptidase [Nitrospira sp.]
MTQSSPPELVVVARPEMELRAMKDGIASAAGADIRGLADVLASEGATMVPLFGLSEERMRDRTASLSAESGEEFQDLSNFYHIDAPEERLNDMAEALRELEEVEAAYVKPASEPPVTKAENNEAINDIQAMPDEPPLATPNFVPGQIYLNAAPAGIDATYAWGIPGGRGAGVKIIDCEWGWKFTHEDLLQNSMGVMVGTSLSYSSNPTANTSANRAVNHGTAVVGVMGGDRNAFGITGICPDANVGAASFVNKPSAQTIREAADKLRPGDIILLEIHRPGPRFNYQSRDDQQGYIAIEWWPDDFAAIRYAVNKGIIVVEAAGNGRQNLDDAIYNTRPGGFPTSWRNPFRTTNPSSGAVVVGAGSPPPGTHGRNHGPDRSRLDFSNYGSRVDCQGWGREVTTTGYGNLQGGSNTNEWYTETFSGTSSASPVVVGALGCVQGVLRAQGGTLITPSKAINLLRTTGSPQQDGPGRPRTQRIGNRPNLRQAIPTVAHGWQYNKKVTRTHAKHQTQMGWAIIEGGSWLRVKPRTPDGVTNTFMILCEALANNRKVDVYLRDGQIEQATLR